MNLASFFLFGFLYQAYASFLVAPDEIRTTIIGADSIRRTRLSGITFLKGSSAILVENQNILTNLTIVPPPGGFLEFPQTLTDRTRFFKGVNFRGDETTDCRVRTLGPDEVDTSTACQSITIGDIRLFSIEISLVDVTVGAFDNGDIQFTGQGVTSATTPIALTQRVPLVVKSTVSEDDDANNELHPALIIFLFCCVFPIGITLLSNCLEMIGCCVCLDCFTDRVLTPMVNGRLPFTRSEVRVRDTPHSNPRLGYSQQYHESSNSQIGVAVAIAEDPSDIEHQDIPIAARHIS